MQNIIGAGRIRKPVFTIDQRAICCEVGKQVLVAAGVEIRHRLSIALHDLKLVSIDPYAPFEIAAAGIHTFRRNVKQVCVAGFELLLAHIIDPIVRQLVAGQNERHAVANVIDVLFSH